MSVYSLEDCIRDVLASQYASVSTDSRKIAKDMLFVPIVGETFDGHDFILSSIEKGAHGVMVQQDRFNAKWTEDHPQVKFYVVEHTINAYREVSYRWRKQFSIPVVAVAGSVGKTTTKEMIAAVLRGKFKNVLKTTGSQNGIIGIPITLLEITAAHDAAVIEVGIDDVGTMPGHMNIVEPTLGLLTAIGPEHLERLIDIATVSREEGIVMDWLSSNKKMAVVRMDDPEIARHSTKFSDGFLVYGFDPKLDLKKFKRYCQGKFTEGHLRVSSSEWKKEEDFVVPLQGEHNAINLLAAISTAVLLNLNADEIRKGLATFSIAMGRTEIRVIEEKAKAPARLKVICDYYNANPSSMKAAIELLSKTKNSSEQNPKQTIACLGDMLELGTLEEQYHRELAEEILKNKVTQVLLYGDRMRWLSQELQKNKFTFVEHFTTHEALAKKLCEITKPEDVVLLKGSRGMKMEEVFKVLSSSV